MFLPPRLNSLALVLVMAISTYTGATMIGDELLIRRAFPNVETDFTTPVSTTVIAGTSDIVTLQAPFWVINPEANNIIIDVEGSSGMGGSPSTFDGIVFTGFSNNITNVSVVTDVGNLVFGVDFGSNFINLNLSGGFDSSDFINLQVDFAPVVPEPTSWILLGLGAFVIRIRKRFFLG